MIKNYEDFINSLLQAGFSLGGGSKDKIFSVVPWKWNETPPYETPVTWHTGDAQTDPWEWRIRVLDERKDIAYGKLFFKKSGFITKEWYPYFLAVRRGGRSFEEEYGDGKLSYDAKRIYELIQEYEVLPLHAMKQLGGFSKEEGSRFDRALVELQMKMYLTMCGRQQKLSKKGEEYGWSSTVFCTVEHYFGREVFERAEEISPQEAIEKITEQVYRLNPEAEQRKILKFIKG